VFDPAIAAEIEERFRRRGRKMAEINKRQAHIVAGGLALPNARGTAPGQWIEAGDRLVILLPGPPSELHEMFQQQCVPRLRDRIPQVVIRTRFYRVTGMTESDLDALIAPVYTKCQNPVCTVLASAGDIQVHLRCRCNTEEEAERLLKEVGDPIEALLGPRLYSRNGDSMEQVIAAIMQDRCYTVSTAESCTGGMLGERLTSLPGSSKCFIGGFLTYNDQMKIELLGVDPALIEAHTAVSAEVAQAMAEGARTRTGSMFGVSTTGEAGPESSTGAPVGTVFIGLAREGAPTVAKRFLMPGDRDRVRGFTTNAALDMLRRAVLGIE
jgi:nicotinamide-nucleotide amidase